MVVTRSLADNRPELDEESVRRALRAIHRADELPERHPFHSFLIFRQQMQQPERLSGRLAQVDAVAEWLEGVFAEKLGMDDLPNCDIIERLTMAFRSGSSFHEGMTWLYAHYMRPDMALTVEAVADILNTDRGTLPRREKEVLPHLTTALIRQETDARRRRHETLLKGRIPMGARDLLGREGIIESALTTLRSKQAPVLLVGMPGIGKTTLAAQIALAWLPEIADLYWLDVSPGMDCAAQIAELVSPAAGKDRRADLLAYLIDNRTLLVLEGIESQHLPRLRMPALRHASLLCTSQKRLPDWEGVVLHIPPLEEDQAARCYDMLRGDLPQSEFAEAFRASEGIPGALGEYVRRKQYFPSGRAASQLPPERYFADTWQMVSALQHQLWLVTALAQARGITLRLAESLLDAREEDVAELVNNHVLMIDSASSLYQTTPGALAHIDRQLMGDGPLDDFAETVIAQPTITQPQLHFLLALTHARLLEFLSESVGKRWLNALALRAAKLGLWESWASVCEILNEKLAPDERSWLDLWLRLEDARQQRWRGELAASFRLLRDLVQDAGGKGFFDLYGRGLLEMSIIASLREDWQVAAEAASDAEQTFIRLQWDVEAAQAILVAARALMPNDPAAALRRIEPLTAQYDSAASLACEISLAVGEAADAVAFANQAVDLTEPDTPNYGRALSMLALSFHADDRHDDALDCQLQAINALQMTTDVVGLARGFNNLGVIYYALKDQQQARDAWEEAQERMLAFQDAAGLDAVRDNLKLLDDDDGEAHLLT